MSNLWRQRSKRIDAARSGKATGDASLTGFVIASRLLRERQPPGAPEFIARPLPYMAPEQTGRMNRSIDSPRDPYALGPYRCRCFLNYNLRAEPTSCTLVAVVGELEAHRATGFNENVHKRRHSFLAYPIPL